MGLFPSILRVAARKVKNSERVRSAFRGYLSGQHSGFPERSAPVQRFDIKPAALEDNTVAQSSTTRRKTFAGTLARTDVSFSENAHLFASADGSFPCYFREKQWRVNFVPALALPLKTNSLEPFRFIDPWNTIARWDDVSDNDRVARLCWRASLTLPQARMSAN